MTEGPRGDCRLATGPDCGILARMNDRLETFWSQLRRVLEYPLADLGDHQLTLTSLLFLTALVVLVFVAESLLRRQLIRRVLQRTYLAASLQ